ncbi:unnamed protein product, partial [Symbiodinium sp. CCMP2456]
MPSVHSPQSRAIQTLKTKISTGRTLAKPGCVGRELTEQEVQACREKLAGLEAQRERGIKERKVTRETLHNTWDLKEGQAELKQGQGEIMAAVDRIEQKLDRKQGAEGSSQYHREMAKEAAKREREDAKDRLLLRAGLQKVEGDSFVDGVLVKAGVPLERFEAVDLGAKIEFCGIACRVAMVEGEHATLQLAKPVNRLQLSDSREMLNRQGLLKITAYMPRGERYFESVVFNPKSPGLFFDKPVNGKPRLHSLPESAIVRLVISADRLLEHLPGPVGSHLVVLRMAMNATQTVGAVVSRARERADAPRLEHASLHSTPSVALAHTATLGSVLPAGVQTLLLREGTGGAPASGNGSERRALPSVFSPDQLVVLLLWHPCRR